MSAAEHFMLTYVFIYVVLRQILSVMSDERR